MDLALHDAEHGYYTRGASRLGRELQYYKDLGLGMEEFLEMVRERYPS